MRAYRNLTRTLATAVTLGALAVAPPAAAGTAETAGDTGAVERTVGEEPMRTRSERVRAALRVALNQRGDRYRYGAEGPRRFDCSGLVYFSTHRAGLTSVPRTSSEQARAMPRVRRGALRRGDFVFFTGRSGVYHVGMYVGRADGRRRILHAPGTGERVRIDPIWTDQWFAGTLRRR